MQKTDISEGVQLNPETEIGTCLSDFRILSQLGKGSYGTVYRVVSLLSNKEFVIKKIDMTHIKAKEKESALKEVEILKRVKHPNIIQYYTSFFEKEDFCIVMEYADDGDLQTHIKNLRSRKKYLPEDKVWDYAVQLAQAMQCLHTNNIIHRDIKTLNIFMTKKNKLKLGDMGVSKIVRAKEMQATRVGTPLYLAPELVKQKPYNYKVDIWALGCVVYQIAALEPPFIGDNLISLGFAIINKTQQNLPSFYSGRLTGFVWKLLEKDPNKRPTASEIIDRILQKTFKRVDIEKKNSENKIDVRNEKEFKNLRSSPDEKLKEKDKDRYVNKIKNEEDEKQYKDKIYINNNNNNNNLINFNNNKNKIINNNIPNNNIINNNNNINIITSNNNNNNNNKNNNIQNIQDINNINEIKKEKFNEKYNDKIFERFFEKNEKHKQYEKKLENINKKNESDTDIEKNLINNERKVEKNKEKNEVFQENFKVKSQENIFQAAAAQPPKENLEKYENISKLLEINKENKQFPKQEEEKKESISNNIFKIRPFSAQIHQRPSSAHLKKFHKHTFGKRYFEKPKEKNKYFNEKNENLKENSKENIENLEKEIKEKEKEKKKKFTESVNRVYNKPVCDFDNQYTLALMYSNRTKDITHPNNINNNNFYNSQPTGFFQETNKTLLQPKVTTSVNSIPSIKKNDNNLNNPQIRKNTEKDEETKKIHEFIENKNEYFQENKINKKTVERPQTAAVGKKKYTIKDLEAIIYS